MIAPQHTLKTSISCLGVGLHSGLRVALTLHPAAIDSGIRFRRTDVAGQGAVLPALWSQVGDTRLNTSLAIDTPRGPVAVGTVEHLMSALAGAGVDNCLIDLTGPEVPVMDGSAAPFLFLIGCAGTVAQAAPRRAIRILHEVSVAEGDAVATLRPLAAGETAQLDFTIDFSHAPLIGRQTIRLALNEPTAFQTKIARARTFGFEPDVAALRAAGLARGGSLANAVVLDATGTRALNQDGLRWADEFVRHKALDAIGDLALAGAPLLGHFHGECSGHALTNRLLRALFATPDAWAFEPALAKPRPVAPADRSVADLAA